LILNWFTYELYISSMDITPMSKIMFELAGKHKKTYIQLMINNESTLSMWFFNEFENWALAKSIDTWVKVQDSESPYQITSVYVIFTNRDMH
jgi:hypothetical protein